jgi:hypothetical protein
MFIITLAGLAGMAWVYTRARQEHVDVVAVTNCPVDGPRSYTALLIDRTDTLSPQQQLDVRARIDQIVASVPQHGALAVYSISGDDDPLEPRALFCNPGRADDVSPWTGNPTTAERRWEQVFDVPVQQVFDELLTTGKATSSPILEAIQAVSITFFASAGSQLLPKRLYIVSDMLQHVPEFSQYRKHMQYQSLRSSNYYRRIKTALRYVDVEILYVRRDGAEAQQGAEHVKFWQEYFADQGATVTRVIAVQG